MACKFWLSARKTFVERAKDNTPLFLSFFLLFLKISGGDNNEQKSEFTENLAMTSCLFHFMMSLFVLL